MRPPSARTLVTWSLHGVGLVVGVSLLQANWELFNAFAVNRRPAYPAGWAFEIMFWYALPGFQAGVLVGLLPFAASRGIGIHALTVLNRAVWAEILLNMAIFWFLVSRGVMF